MLENTFYTIVSKESNENVYSVKRRTFHLQSSFPQQPNHTWSLFDSNEHGVAQGEIRPQFPTCRG